MRHEITSLVGFIFLGSAVSAGSPWALHDAEGTSNTATDGHSPVTDDRSRPRLVYVTINKQQDLRGPAELAMGKLEKCGFYIEEWPVTSQAQWEKRLADSNLASGVPVLIDSHGVVQKDSVLKDGKIQEVNRYVLDPGVNGHSLDGKQFFESLKDKYPDHSVFLDACFAGNCAGFGNCRLGMSCGDTSIGMPLNRAREKQMTPVMEDVTDLLCDSLRSCQLIRGRPGVPGADTNGDGVLDGDEINAYIGLKRGFAEEVDEFGFVFSEAELDEKKRACEDRKLRFSSKSSTEKVNIHSTLLRQPNGTFGASYVEKQPVSWLERRESPAGGNPLEKAERHIGKKIKSVRTRPRGQGNLRDVVVTEYHVEGEGYWVAYHRSDQEERLIYDFTCKGGKKRPSFEEETWGDQDYKLLTPFFQPNFKIACRKK